MEHFSATDTAFVLLPGGGLGSWSWQWVIPFLRLPALALNLPDADGSRRALQHISVADCADRIAAVIKAAGFKRVILITHSYSGVLAHPIAARLPNRIAHLVFVAAVVPLPGKRALDTYRWMNRWNIRMRLRLQRWGISPPRGLVRYTVRRDLLNDMEDATVRWTLGRYSTSAIPALFFERANAPTSTPVPSTYIKLLQDRGALPPEAQDSVIASLGRPSVLTLDTGHTAMLSRPRELAALLNLIVARAETAPLMVRELGA